MRVIVEQSLDCRETEIKITCGLPDERLKRLVDYIRQYAFSITVQKDGQSMPIALEDIYYFDTVDNKTFLYVKKDIYECDHKLYQLEEQLKDTPFIRISKNCIVNTTVVKSVRILLSGQMEATLGNNEKLLVSRHYLKAFRDKFV